MALRVQAARYPSPPESRYSTDSGESNPDSGSEEDVDYETDDTEVDDDLVDPTGDYELLNNTWPLTDQEHPPEYYISQQKELDVSDDIKQDYAPNSTKQLDRIEQQWLKYCHFVRRPLNEKYSHISKGLLHSFFDWRLNQRRGKKGRRLRGTKRCSSLGNYWKTFRLVYERSTGGKVDARLNRQMHTVLRKLAKKHGLSQQPSDKPTLEVDGVVLVAQTNLTTVEKRYTHGQLRIDIHTLMLLAFPTGQRPEALLNLRYRHIVVTLLRDPEGGPHRVLLEFTFEFTKGFLGMKEANTFPIPEIICDPSLILSPHVFLLGRLFKDRAFAAPGLTGPKGLSQLDIPPGCNELRLNLRDDLADIHVFRRPVKTVDGWRISATEPLTYEMLYNAMKTLGIITGMRQIVRPYTLRYGAGKAFDANGNISDALRNLIMQHADTRTFLKHYLSRRVDVDTLAIVRGLQPQDSIMHAACRMSRSVDPRRPQKLTSTQALSVNNDPEIQALLERRACLKDNLGRLATENEEYGLLGREISKARQRKRYALLPEVLKRWDKEQAIADIEFQLSGGTFQRKLNTDIENSDDRSPEHKRLIQMVMTLPGTSLEEERSRRDAAIAAVMAYCLVEEGGPRRGRPPWSPKWSDLSPAAVDEAPKVDRPDTRARSEQEKLDQAVLSVNRDKRTRYCWMCVANKLLDMNKRVYQFGAPGDVTKHFRRRHLNLLRDDESVPCNLCDLVLKDKMHVKNHAFRIHGTVP